MGQWYCATVADEEAGECRTPMVGERVKEGKTATFRAVRAKRQK